MVEQLFTGKDGEQAKRTHGKEQLFTHSAGQDGAGRGRCDKRESQCSLPRAEIGKEHECLPDSQQGFIIEETEVEKSQDFFRSASRCVFMIERTATALNAEQPRRSWGRVWSIFSPS